MGSLSTIDTPSERSRERSRQRGGGSRGGARESLARPRAAKHSSNRVAAREIVLEAEILLQRLLHLTAPPEDEAAVLLETARQVYESRRARDRIFGAALFADPAWDILLDLYIARREGRKVTITSACMAASAPTSTATRHIAHLMQKGLVLRLPHPADARSSHLDLSAAGDRKLSQLFREIVKSGGDRV